MLVTNIVEIENKYFFNDSRGIQAVELKSKLRLELSKNHQFNIITF